MSSGHAKAVNYGQHCPPNRTPAALDHNNDIRYYLLMIRSFATKETELVFNRRFSRKLPHDIQRRARIKLEMLDADEQLEDLRLRPSNYLENLSGNRAGQQSIRINDQWRLYFTWENGHAYQVEITDYH